MTQLQKVKNRHPYYLWKKVIMVGWVGRINKLNIPRTAAWSIKEEFDNYVYLLEAAVQGDDLALGWHGFANRYLESEALVAMDIPWFSKDTQLFARLTRFGEQSAAAKKCLNLLGQLVWSLSSGF